MSYGGKSLNDWRDEALDIAVSHGFTDATVGECIALMHSELSEALEDHRDGRAPAEVWYEEKIPCFDSKGEPIVVDGKHVHTVVRHPNMVRTRDGAADFKHLYKPCGIPSELADVIIRVLHFCGKYGIDIEQAVREKMIYNDSRPFKHGKIL